METHMQTLGPEAGGVASELPADDERRVRQGAR
jgi:hypothetical protein